MHKCWAQPEEQLEFMWSKKLNKLGDLNRLAKA